MSRQQNMLYRLKESSGELRKLPEDWTFDVKADADKRISFTKISTKETTFNHPTLGGLPAPWILKLVKDKKGLHVIYYNREKDITTTKDPRFSVETLEKIKDCAPNDLWVSATVRRNTKVDLNKFVRSPPLAKNIRDQFKIIHTIDAGDGTKGGMNGGVFVVHIKSIPCKIYIEKRFKDDHMEIARQEITMLYRLKHPALTFYSAAFMTPGPSPQSSVYVEFCDKGSLDDIIKEYAKRGPASFRHRVPEAFVWHALIGLCDGLAYMQGGKSFFAEDNGEPDKNWIPILHRDLKPDNVLLRSRSTVGSEKYPYCVLSDFGLACEDRSDRDPKADIYQRARSKIGTNAYWAPELCYDPYPKMDNRYSQHLDLQYKVFPGTARHSRYSDVWALGASIYNLCNPQPGNPVMHMEFDRKPQGLSYEYWMEGTACRIKDLRVPDYYSSQLREGIRLATRWSERERPDAIKLIKQLACLNQSAGFVNHEKPEKLPDWATRVHEYLAKAERQSKN